VSLPPVTYLSFDSMAEGVGWSQVVPYVEGLARRGVHMTLHSFEKGGPEEVVARRLEAAGVVWHPHPFGVAGSAGGLARVAHGAALVARAELVHARSDMAAASALVSRRPAWVWDVRAFWREQRIAAGQIRAGSRPDRALGAVETRAAVRSTGVVTLTRAAADELAVRHGPDLAAKSRVIPTCVELDRFPCSPLPPGEVVRFLLAGTLSPVYDVPTMLALVERVARRRPAELTVLAPDVTSWDDHLASAGVTPGRAGRAEMPARVASHHIGLSVLRPDLGVSSRAITPTKLGEFLASGRPVIVNSGLGDMDDLVAAYDCGVVLRALTEDGLETAADEVDRLLGDGGTAARCRKLAEDHFDLERGVDQLLELYGVAAR
jgi:glycosyltransferase involved in cell wall biosynthesis